MRYDDDGVLTGVCEECGLQAYGAEHNCPGHIEDQDELRELLGAQCFEEDLPEDYEPSIEERLAVGFAMIGGKQFTSWDVDDYDD